MKVFSKGKWSLILLIGLGVSFSAFGNWGHGATIEPVAVADSSDGSVTVADILVTYGDGQQEYLEIQLDGGGVTTPGGFRTPAIANFPVHGAPATGGSWGEGPHPGDGGGGNPPPVVQAIGAGIVISAAGCAGGFLFARRALRRECERNGREVDSMTIGYCGVFGSSSVDCSAPPPAPPEPPQGQDAAFWSGNYSGMWQIPNFWGWEDPEQLIISDGF